MSPGRRIDYKALRQVNPEAARLAVLEYLKTNGGNISDAARVFGINRSVVYDILEKQAEGDLKDRSRVPKHQPNKTPAETEQKVVEARNKTRFGPERLSIYLKKYEGIDVPPGTIRHILRRNRHLLIHSSPKTRRRREKREFVDWYSAKPFEIVQVDVKYIRDQKALTKQQIIHLDRCAIPNYQWGAHRLPSQSLMDQEERAESRPKSPGDFQRRRAPVA
jgi:transposase